ncbi:MAG: hypothetical protein M3162_01055 [Thermoproteota archaeon]|nr:hypothetical protein [Thermoproteota archaeon]
MSKYNTTRNVHVIVHGQRQLFETIKSRLSEFGFDGNKLVLADMNKTGNVGDYVAMLWPPMAPKEVIVSEITDFNGNGRGMGAWAQVNQKEIDRIALT